MSSMNDAATPFEVSKCVISANKACYYDGGYVACEGRHVHSPLYCGV